MCRKNFGNRWSTPVNHPEETRVNAEMGFNIRVFVIDKLLDKYKSQL